MAECTPSGTIWTAHPFTNLPAPAESAVDFDHRQEMVCARRDERGFGFVEAAFGIENVQILAFTLAKANRRHPRRLAAGADLLVAHRKTGPDCTIGRQRVLDIAKGDQDGPVVIDQRRIGASIGDADRSEEHTSELQSLMRLSYAVFCL